MAETREHNWHRLAGMWPPLGSPGFVRWGVACSFQMPAFLVFIRPCTWLGKPELER